MASALQNTLSMKESVSLGKLLCENIDEVVELWYFKWKESVHPHPEISEAALKDNLPEQLKIIGKQLQELETAELPTEMWKITNRLDPELRVSQEIAVEEVVQEYKIVFAAVQEWINKNGYAVEFQEYSYFYEAIFELTAEAVRRYAKFRDAQIKKERGDYLSALAHQMRTPLMVISNQIELLASSKAKALTEEEFERLTSNIHRLQFLINGVMRLERFKGEDIPVHPLPVYPADLLENIIADYKSEARQKGLALEFNGNRSIQMETDPNLFIDILGNLVQNAVKYTDKGFVKISLKREKNGISFMVKDSGEGIVQERQEKIFEPINPAKSGGVGVGLTIAQRGTHALNGTIDLASVPGSGSTFKVWLPLKVAAKNTAQLSA